MITYSNRPRVHANSNIQFGRVRSQYNFEFLFACFAELGQIELRCIDTSKEWILHTYLGQNVHFGNNIPCKPSHDNGMIWSWIWKSHHSNIATRELGERQDNVRRTYPGRNAIGRAPRVKSSTS